MRNVTSTLWKITLEVHQASLKAEVLSDSSFESNTPTLTSTIIPVSDYNSGKKKKEK